MEDKMEKEVWMRQSLLSIILIVLLVVARAQPSGGPSIVPQINEDKTPFLLYRAPLEKEGRRAGEFLKEAGSTSGSAVSANKTISVLVVDGFSNHDWKQTTKVSRWILEKSGLFKVDVLTIPPDSAGRNAWRPDFKKYALIIQNTNNISEPRLRWPASAEKELETYVRNGGGLYVLHSANNAFSHWKEYNTMIGLGWRSADEGYALEVDSNRNIIRHSPGEGKSTGHGDRFNALIQILTRHPINDGLPDRWQTANTEVYYYPRGSAQNITVLSYAFDSTGTQKMWPVEWIVNYGKGRVYNSSMGHLWKGETYPPAYRCVGFQTTMIRAAEWLATGEVTYPIPADFPTGTSVSLKPPSELMESGKN